MQTTIMLLFYGFLAGILVMCAGFRRWRHAVGLLLFDDFGLRIFVHTAVKSGGQ